MISVELEDYTYGAVEKCSRVAGLSYAKDARKDDEKFVKMLITRGHLGVLEHVSYTFKIEGISRACSHQFVRHRMGSFLQRSQRYVDERDPNYILPELDYITDKHERDFLKGMMNGHIVEGFRTYDDLIKGGVRFEDARYVLPNACETKLYWTVNARALRHFLKLRLHKTAQHEIRTMAKAMFSQVVYLHTALFDDLEHLYKTGEYSKKEGGLE